LERATANQRHARDIAILAQEKLAEIIEVSVDEIGLDTDLLDELGMDSLQQLELITVIEGELKVRLTSEEWRRAHTLVELAGLFLEELSHSGAPLPR
jgi:acyl carrier protein